MKSVDAKSTENLSIAYEQLHRYAADLQKAVVERRKAFQEIKEAHLEVLRRLAVASEYKDDDTGTHIVRMAHFSAALARHLVPDPEFAERLYHASPMHDIGKIGIPDQILKKPGKLTPEEWDVMRTHPEIGAKILGGSKNPTTQLAAEVALSHHEKYDGTGYPGGLRGEDIPLGGRIVALADFFDALTMDRCYRPAFDDETVFKMIREQAGSHFDPVVVEAFFEIKDELIKLREMVNSQSSQHGVIGLETGESRWAVG